MSAADGLPRLAESAAEAQVDSAGEGNARRALVFGGGGVLGFAWTVGALSALEAEFGITATSVGLTVGTSAGSIVAALTGCGIGVDVLLRHHQGVPAPADPTIEWDYQSDSGGALPPRPGLRPGSPRLLLDAVRHPMSASATMALTGLLPRGRGTLEPIHDVIATASLGGLPGLHWPERPRTWIVATDYDSGSRVVFGRDDIPANLAEAVCASCAIPAWYSPVEIAGRHYIDGGTASNASADVVLPLVEDGTIDEVFVLAPMASVQLDRPRSPVTRLERIVRRAITRGIQSDIARLRAAGARVVLLTPGPHDLEVMGPNLMNPKRRTEVLRTSVLTSAAQLRELRLRADAGAAGSIDEADSVADASVDDVDDGDEVWVAGDHR